ncbi:hypothetical protein [Paludisphaera borealis]|nr:hypothetical protein [Paludisphaera borealis]
MRVPAIRDAPGRIAQPAPATARRAAVAVLHDPNVTAKPLPLGDRPRIDLAERAHRQADASQHATAASIDAVLDRPEEFLGSRFILEGVFKVGTRILNPKDKNGFKLGSTITIARDDDRTISTLEGKVFGHDLHIILEEQVARNLQQLFGRLKMAATTKPTYKTILGVRIENSPKEVDGEPALIVIESLEILGSCDYYLVASRSYANAFKVALVDVTGGRIDHGDGEKWVSRLGGEEKFVGPLRRKLRDLRRRAINDAHGAVVDAVLRSELDRWSRISAAINTINTIQARRLTENH